MNKLPKKFLAKQLTLLIAIVGMLLTFGFALTNKKQVLGETKAISPFFLAIQSDFSAQVNELDEAVRSMEEMVYKIDQKSLQKRFKSARLQYKKMEWLVEYQFRETALKINAPNLLEADAHTPNEPVYPTGFQVLEEVLFDEEYNKKKVEQEINSLRFGVNRLKKAAKSLFLDESMVLHALKLNMYRIIIKGISGFDSPAAFHSLPEAHASLESVKKVVSRFNNSSKLDQRITSAIQFLEAYSGDFDGFDRAQFIRMYMNPICDELLYFQLVEQIPFAQEPQSAISPRAANLFSENAFDPLFFAPSDALALSGMNISLGERLFYDTNLSLDKSRNGASCHQPNKGFTDGLKVNISLDQGFQLERNTPTLLNAGLQAAQFLDSRVHHLEDQAHAVITNSNEMGGVFLSIQKRLAQDKSYQKQFKQVFGKSGITERNIKLAVGAYVRSLTSMNSRFDLYMRGNDRALDNDEIKGFNLFMGKAKCATCHFVPLFNGSAPPFYDKAESEVLGVPNQVGKSNAQLDKDLGKYLVYGIAHQRNSFKTTSVRNVNSTAPYMHNGVFATLEELITFYNEGGGAGYGFSLPNQTLPSDELNLSETEQKQIILFMKSLDDNPWGN